MEKERTVRDILNMVISDREQEPGGRLYDLVYVITMMQTHQWLDLNHHGWDDLESLFDMVMNREQWRGLHCGRRISVPELPENVEVENLIQNAVSILLNEARKRRNSAEELVQDLKRLPVEENIYSNLLLLREHIFFSVLVDQYFYYIHYENEDTWMLRRIHVSKLQEGWKPEHGECIFPNVVNFFYNEVKQCLSIQLKSVNTFVRYYPATEALEVVYHKALEGMNEVGDEICIDQPREIIASEDAVRDYYWIHTKGRIGLFEIIDGKVVAKADYISEGFVMVRSGRIRLVNEKVSLKFGEVYFDLVRDRYIVRWPYNCDLKHITEVEEIFWLNEYNSVVIFLDKKKNIREIKEMEVEEWPV